MSQLPNRLLIAQSAKSKGKSRTGGVAKDLTFGDYSLQQILNIREEFRQDHEELALGKVTTENTTKLFRRFIDMTEYFSAGKSESIVKRMIDNFRNNKRVSDEYHYPRLNERAKNHPKTLAFESIMQSQLQRLVVKFKGDIYKIKPDRHFDKNAVISFLRRNSTRAKSGRNRTKSTTQAKGISFEQPEDILINGLTIAVHDVWAWKMELTQFKETRASYDLAYVLTLYDHFGLDENDINKFGWLEGFRAWFILQHLVGFAFKPYITTMEIERKVRLRKY